MRNYNIAGELVGRREGPLKSNFLKRLDAVVAPRLAAVDQVLADLGSSASDRAITERRSQVVGSELTRAFCKEESLKYLKLLSKLAMLVQKRDRLDATRSWTACTLWP